MSDGDTTGAVTPLQSAHGLARTLVRLGGVLLAVAFGWFAYVDAPLADVALLLFAVGAAAATAAIIAALLSIEASLSATPGARSVRLRRMGLLLLAIALVLMVTSATLTLSLQGTMSDQQDESSVST
jgi:NADH:ubiquinone oxidoreductase subunit 6 (subunit J)